MIIGDDAPNRPTNPAALALERKKSSDLTVGLYDGHFDIILHHGNDVCKLVVKIRTDKIWVRLLQPHPDAYEVIAELLTGNKSDLHPFRGVNTHERLRRRTAV